MVPAPNDLPDDIASLKALILAARAETALVEAERQRLDREHAALTGEVVRLTAQNARLDHIVAVLRRAQFGGGVQNFSHNAVG